MKFKKLSFMLMLTCLLAVRCYAGDPIMPPAPAPTPGPQTSGTQNFQETPEDTLPDAFMELIAAITGLFTSAR